VCASQRTCHVAEASVHVQGARDVRHVPVVCGVGMKHLPMSCECCEVFEVGEQRNGRYWSRVFRVNGTRYVGFESVGSAFGLSSRQAGGRTERGTWLGLSWHEAMAQRAGRREKPGSDELARRLCRVMALLSYGAQRKTGERGRRG